MSVNMSKGQRISLEKRGGGELTRVRMGLGWDAIPKKGLFGRVKQKAIDLDASCVVLDGSRSEIDAVWFRKLKSSDGSITHTGDNLTGEGEGDDESIIVELDRVPRNAQTLVFTVTSYSSQGFSEVQNAFCRLVDETNGSEVARFDLSATGPHTAMILATVYRDSGGSGWKMAAIGDTGKGKTYKDMTQMIQNVA
jgi:tellurium resistance protein TerZ